MLAAVDELGLGPGAVELAMDEAIEPVLADPVLLQRVLVNVLANAHHHSPPGTPVRISTSSLGGRAQIRVIDHGPGIPPERHGDVFAPFQRLGDTDNTTGLGLGLALSKGFTEGMRGQLVPEQTPGGGLTMVIELPLASSAAQEGRIEG
ncbi:signal transduction histidine kinase [Microbacterium arborescens]|nr:signal transduction histidine kinase [Microbacterium arborescens]